MSKLVYDLALRYFHWIFSSLFLTVYLISNIFDDESSIFPYHMILGFLVVAAALFRILWGFIGSKHSRFSNFSLAPASLLAYLRGVTAGKSTRFVGHNPASSWAGVIFLILALGLGLTGYFMATSGENEFLEEIHELMSNVFIFITIAHLVGLLIHHWRHQDSIGMSMVHGKKNQVPKDTQPVRAHGWVALLFLLFMLGSFNYLRQNYDPSTQELKLLGNTLILGENEAGDSENHSRERASGKRDHEEDDDDDDDD